MENIKHYSVFCGGIEVNDLMLSSLEAAELQKHYQDMGYDDVHVVDLNLVEGEE
jgi:hypothetical protein